MNNAIPLGHPYWHIKTLAEEHSHEIAAFNFSYYKYLPQSLIDSREDFKLSIDDFISVKSVEKIIQNVPHGRELALHSAVELINGDIYQIPMIDMSTTSTTIISKLRPFLGDDLFNKFKWYKSGRSFHGYGHALIENNEWVRLMGSFLLVNQIGMPTTVDPRWIGHRLIAGYAALRWSFNTDQYLSLPKEII